MHLRTEFLIVQPEVSSFADAPDNSSRPANILLDFAEPVRIAPYSHDSSRKSCAVRKISPALFGSGASGPESSGGSAGGQYFGGNSLATRCNLALADREGWGHETVAGRWRRIAHFSHSGGRRGE